MLARRCKWTCLFWVVAVLLVSESGRAARLWEKPAAELADRIAEILGPGQAQITVSNRSTVAAGEVPSIRRLLEQDLRAHGVQLAGSESANQIRITLSDTSRQRLWVAEVVEGSQTRVAMVPFDREEARPAAQNAAMLLTRKVLWSSSGGVGAPILAALETRGGLVLLEEHALAVESLTASGWREEKRVELGRRGGESRDPRGIVVGSAEGFTAYAAGIQCEGRLAMGSAAPSGDWTIECHERDDPWPVTASALGADTARLRAFFNPGRNFYTGVVTPSLGLDLAPFYSMAALPGPRLIFVGIDGRVQLLDGNRLKPLSGARDWGSDFAAVRTGCGSGVQIVATSSGEAENESARAYEVSGQEAVAASAPLEMGGTVTAIWTAPDGASALAVVQRSLNEYEVARIAALCP